MDALDAMRRTISTSGKSNRDIAREMGKSPTYLSSTLTRGSIPSIATAATIADACGYDLALVNRATGERIVIDPRDSRKARA